MVAVDAGHAAGYAAQHFVGNGISLAGDGLCGVAHGAAPQDGFPFVARLVETSLRELDEGVVEAAQSMGATPFQIITKVMIPECLPGLISSMTTALTTILGYSAMSGVIGGGGLGKIALSYGYYRYQTNIMIVCVVLLVLMVQAFQSVGTLWATKSDKRLRK